MFQVDYDQNPGFRHDSYYTGTVYFDAENAEFGVHDGVWSYGDPDVDRWYIRSDYLGHYTYFWVNAIDGLFIGMDGSGIYQLTRQ